MKQRAASLLFAVLSLFLANCRSSRSGYSGADSSTPSHGMSQSEYPFDEYGNYREDWVKNGKPSYASQYENADVVDLTKDNPRSPFAGTSEASDDRPKQTKRSSSSSSRSKSTASKSKPKPKKPAPKYTTITIKKGDTLYGLAKRYGTSVKAIQSANGMGGATALRDGRSLKIPR